MSGAFKVFGTIGEFIYEILVVFKLLFTPVMNLVQQVPEYALFLCVGLGEGVINLSPLFHTVPKKEFEFVNWELILPECSQVKAKLLCFTVYKFLNIHKSNNHFVFTKRIIVHNRVTAYSQRLLLQLIYPYRCFVYVFSVMLMLTNYQPK